MKDRKSGSYRRTYLLKENLTFFDIKDISFCNPLNAKCILRLARDIEVGATCAITFLMASRKTTSLRSKRSVA